MEVEIAAPRPIADELGVRPPAPAVAGPPARPRVGDTAEAEDLAQQALLRAAERWPLPPGSDIARWLAVVGNRLAINKRRRRRRWEYLPIRETDQMWAMTTDPDLWRALADLDRRTHVSLVLTVSTDTPQDESVSCWAYHARTVASWLWRGRAGLGPC